MKIAVYTIAFNEAANVPGWLETSQDADYRVVADTGSTDGTPDLLRGGGASVTSVSVKPWRFDIGRNVAMALVPADTEVLVPLDLDERLRPGWRQEIERAWAPGTTRLRYTYTWSWLPPGVPDVQFQIDRIHARSGYTWRIPTHEHLSACIPEHIADAPGLFIDHYPAPDKSHPGDLSLLELAVREHVSPRSLWYLGRELVFRGQWQRAQATLQEYLDHPAATWAAERSHAMRLLASAHAGTMDVAGRLRWLRRAIAEDPWQREGHVDLAQAHYEAGDWVQGYAAACAALAIAERSMHYLTHGYAYAERPNDLASVCAWNLGMTDAARQHLTAALALAPGDPRLQQNARLMGMEKATAIDL